MGDDIRETEVDFDIDRPLTEEEIQQTIFYNRHDVKELKKVLKETWSDFEGQLDIIELYNLPFENISKTKVQLAAKVLNAVEQHTMDDEFSIDVKNNKCPEVIIEDMVFRKSNIKQGFGF